MCWFLFMVGLFLAILGSFIMASDYDIEIKEYSFDSDTLGACLLGIGSVLAVLMLVGIGIAWLNTHM